MIVKDIGLIQGDYDLFYIDPPWPIKRGGKKNARPNSSGVPLPYKTMNLKEIKEMIQLSVLRSPNANIFLWVIQKYYIEADQIMKELGYMKHTDIIWDKNNGVCPAYTLRFSHEYLQWWYPKGKLLMPCKPALFSTVIKEPSRKHSQKPEQGYIMLETMFPQSKKMEMFARVHRITWDAFGDEIESEEEIINEQ